MLLENRFNHNVINFNEFYLYEPGVNPISGNYTLKFSNTQNVLQFFIPGKYGTWYAKFPTNFSINGSN